MSALALWADTLFKVCPPMRLSGHTFGRATRAGAAGLGGAELKGAGGILTELGGDGWSWAVVE